MSNFVDAVTKSQKLLRRRGYEYKRAISYVHPSSYNEALNNTQVTDHPEFSRQQTINGGTVERSPNVPEDLVVTVHRDAMRLGSNAVAFEEIEDDEMTLKEAFEELVEDWKKDANIYTNSDVGPERSMSAQQLRCAVDVENLLEEYDDE